MPGTALVTGGKCTASLPVSPGIFRMKGGSQSGELVGFETDAAGDVTRLVVPGFYMVRQRAS